MNTDKLQVGRVYTVATESLPVLPETIFSYYELKYLGRDEDGLYRFDAGTAFGIPECRYTHEQVRSIERLRWA